MTELATLPAWAQILVTLLALAGSIFVVVGTLGLVTLPSYFQRAHATSLGTTMGAWLISAAAVLFFSVLGGELNLQALLIAVFLTITAPVASVFLSRAALFRKRVGERRGVDKPM